MKIEILKPTPRSPAENLHIHIVPLFFIYIQSDFYRKSLIIYWWSSLNFWDEELDVNPKRVSCRRWSCKRQIKTKDKAVAVELNY